MNFNYTDSLTGILNTAGFIKQGTSLCEKGIQSNYTGVFLNIKGFRYINQRFGFTHGNDTMCKYAHRIQALLLPDEVFARLGCDNYALLVKKERVDALLDSLYSIRVHIQLDDFVNTFDLSSRAGLYAINPKDTMNDIINRITVAGFLAKSSQHHNAIWFRETMMESYIHDKEISHSFTGAIENNEFSVYYQPKVTLDNQTLCGCEALARWDRIKEVIFPSEFVPILEKEGTICILDFYVLENVCRDLRHWLDMGIEPVRVSTNFSKLHLHNKNLAKDILRILDRYQIDTSYIEIELTETCGYEDFESLTNFVDTMKAHGVHTSLDDFGTGYSSLTLLKDLNVDTIKLDKSFLNQNPNTTNKRSNEIIIKTVINLANDLDMKVICEGVETIEQAQLLRSFQCSAVQGFLFDGPLSKTDFEKRLQTERVYHKI